MVMEDWDLQAVVRGFNNNNNIEGYSSYTIHSPQHNDCFEPFSFSIQENNYQAFHDDLPNSFFQSTAVLTELEQLIYRPFCPTVHSLISSPTMLTSCMSAPKQVHQQDDINQLNNAKASPPKSFKKRRNQQKREVKHVTEDGLSSDMWAWRKYGQKPIKGSPYPRSYYRCSSSKGCSARKQVERSPSNPEMFVVTYTAEHTHAHPTRRSSLAGSTRTKFPQSKTKSFDSTKHVNSPLPISNFDRDHDQHVQPTSIIKMEEVDQISINETDLLTDHRMLSHDQLLPNSLEDHKKGLDEEMNEQTSDLALHNDGFMDDQYFLDDFLSSWLS